MCELRTIVLHKKDNWKHVTREEALKFAHKKYRQVVISDPDKRLSFIQQHIRGIDLKISMFTTLDDYLEEKSLAKEEDELREAWESEQRKKNEFIKR